MKTIEEVYQKIKSEQIIKEIYQRKLTDFVYDLPNKFPYKGLLSQEEAEEIIKQTIHFEKFEEKFNPFVEEELPPLKNIKCTMYRPLKKTLSRCGSGF